MRHRRGRSDRAECACGPVVSMTEKVNYYRVRLWLTLGPVACLKCSQVCTHSNGGPICPAGTSSWKRGIHGGEQALLGLPPLTFHRGGHVLAVEFSRPELYNAIRRPMHEELARKSAQIRKDDTIRAVVLTGQGKAFATAGNPGASSRKPAQCSTRSSRKPGRSLWTSSHRPRPSSRRSTPAVDLGATIALLCDIMLISSTAIISDPHVTVTVTAGDDGAIIWSWLVGMTRPKKSLMTGDKVTASESERIGLMNRVVEREHLLDQAARAHGMICRRPGEGGAGQGRAQPDPARYCRSGARRRVHHRKGALRLRRTPPGRRVVSPVASRTPPQGAAQRTTTRGRIAAPPGSPYPPRAERLGLVLQHLTADQPPTSSTASTSGLCCTRSNLSTRFVWGPRTPGSVPSSVSTATQTGPSASTTSSRVTSRISTSTASGVRCPATACSH